MVTKKARRAPPSPESESPVVSDDDGVDFDYSPSKQNPIADDVEHLTDDAIEGLREGEESDSSSDGDVNPVGDIPMRWYEGYDHIGYDQSGEKIVAKNKPSALDLAADPSAWRRIYDEKNDEEIVLTHQELKEISRMRAGKYPAGDADVDNELINWSGPVMQHPLTSAPDPKRRFLPSRHEARLVIKLVRGMRAGKIRRPSEKQKNQEDDELDYNYDIWESHEPKTREEMTKSERARDIMRVPAPKPPLPTHGESYNPPEEYLPTEKEATRWKALDPEERAIPYLPTKHAALRHVPIYENYINERFERCLDLYLAVRVTKDQTKVNPDDLVPRLPSPRELRPFPTDTVSFFGPLPSRARSIDVHPSGQWLISGSDDGFVRLWEVATGHMTASWNVGRLVKKIDDTIPPVSAVSWCPKQDAFVFCASIGYSLVIVGAASALGFLTEETEAAMKNMKEKLDDKVVENMKNAGIVWTESQFSSQANREGGSADGEEQNGDAGKSNGIPANGRGEDESPTITILHPRPLRTFCWHRKGDYLACVGKDSTGGTVAIHRLTHRSSQVPFKKKTAQVQAIKFHPTRPFFLVATMHHVRIYNLSIQRMVKILKPGVSWISSIDVHPSGDHLLVTSYDKRLCWFDLDLSMRPYKTIRNHDKAVRTARYHPRLPLFADAADDGSCHVFHGMVYDDLNKNALIVPLKRLEKCSKIVDSLGVIDIAWHPRLPWLFTSGADGTIRLLTDCSQG